MIVGTTKIMEEMVMAAKKKTAKKKTQKKKVVAGVKPENNKVPVRKKSRGGKNYKPTGEGPGGTRKGSGRKKGAATKKTREIADKLAADGEITPLEYLLGVMRETPEKLKEKYKAGDIDTEEYMVELAALQKRRDTAAEKAAPYVHARLSSIEAKVDNGAHEKWLALMDEAENAK